MAKFCVSLEVSAEMIAKAVVLCSRHLRSV
jgi:hypothetical protein